MSISLYQLHIKTNQPNDVKSFLVDWLEEQTGEKPSIYENQNPAFDFFKNVTPSIFTISELHENWVTILHDSYEQLLDLANGLSFTFKCTVLNVMAQSTVDTYYLSVHQEGKLVRKIYFGEDVLEIEQEGKPFPFEKLPTGTNIGTGKEPFYSFNYDDMHEFCLHFHVDILKDPTERNGHWVVIKQNNLSLSGKKKGSFFRTIIGGFLKKNNQQ